MYINTEKSKIPPVSYTHLGKICKIAKNVPKIIEMISAIILDSKVYPNPCKNVGKLFCNNVIISPPIHANQVLAHR